MKQACLTMALGLGALWTASSAQAAECKPAHQFTTLKPGVLTVVGFEFPPFVSSDVNGDLVGVDPDILKAFADKECLKIEGRTVDAGAVIQSVISQKADIGAGIWYRTVDRAKVVGLMAPTYLDQMGIYSKDGIDTVSGLVGHTVGTVQGYLWVNDLRKLLGDKLKLYPTPVGMAQDLAAGRIDAGVDSYAVGIVAQKTKGAYPGIQIKVAQPDQRVQASVEPAQSGLPYTKSNTALGAALDASVKELHASGRLRQILSSHGLDPDSENVGEPRLIK